MAAGPIEERNQDATIYVGGLDDKVTEAILWELFLQAGPVVSVHVPRDRITQSHQGFGFVEFMGEEDSDYACRIMNMIKLFGKPVRVNKASAHQKNLDIGANIFIGNLDPEDAHGVLDFLKSCQLGFGRVRALLPRNQRVFPLTLLRNMTHQAKMAMVDEKLLYDTFSAFGVILQTPKIMRDPTSGNSKGFAFINYASFESSDAAIEAMNGQYLCNRAITISYAFKKDSKERHGTAAERLLAAQNPLSIVEKPHQLFADAPVPVPPAGPPGAIPPPPPTMPRPPGIPIGAPPPPPGMGIPGAPPGPPGMPPMQPPGMHGMGHPGMMGPPGTGAPGGYPNLPTGFPPPPPGFFPSGPPMGGPPMRPSGGPGIPPRLPPGSRGPPASWPPPPGSPAPNQWGNLQQQMGRPPNF